MFAPEHVRAWKKVTDAVHAKGAYMACQLWHVSDFNFRNPQTLCPCTKPTDLGRPAASQYQYSLVVDSHSARRPRMSVV